MHSVYQALSFPAHREPGYEAIPYCATRMLNQLSRGHRAWPMFQLKSGAAMAALAAPMPPPLDQATVWR